MTSSWCTWETTPNPANNMIPANSGMMENCFHRDFRFTQMPELSDNKFDLDAESDDSLDLDCIGSKAPICHKQTLFFIKQCAKKIGHANYGPFNKL